MIAVIASYAIGFGSIGTLVFFWRHADMFENGNVGPEPTDHIDAVIREHSNVIRFPRKAA